MKTYYEEGRRRLVFGGSQATAEYWTKRWNTQDLRAQVERDSLNRFCVDTTKRYLPARNTTRILEGGCGQGGVVLGLTRAGYSVQGIDYAAETITRVKQLFPQLQLDVGDVAALPYPDASFDGYWSLGVIEHYYDGYEPIVQEMWRVIKPKGFLFITFPHLNLLRQSKAFFNLYPTWQDTVENKNMFYQFALSSQQVTDDLKKLGFRLRTQQGFDGFKGLKDEMHWLTPWFQNLYANNNRGATLLKNGISIIAAPFAGHAVLLVLQKK